MMYECVVWGIGNDYEKLINQFHFEILKGNIKILALVARPQDIIGGTLDNFKIISKEEMRGGGINLII